MARFKMEEWLKISVLLCIFGFFRTIQPSEPYLIAFLSGEWKNITLEQLNRDALPIGTYSYLGSLVLIFLFTDLFRYKPLIIFSGMAGIVAWSMLIWTKSLFELQILLVFYGAFNATEVAYFTYIYAKVDKKYFSKVTSHTRAALFVGKMVASISSQILIYFELMNYLELNYITLVGQCIATLWALFLPSVKTTIYFHRKDDTALVICNEKSNEIKNNDWNINLHDDGIKRKSICVIDEKSPPNPFQLICRHFKNAYTNRYVLQWSIWYAAALCGYLQIYTYIQALWKAIEPSQAATWNGSIEGTLTFLAAICALSVGYLHTDRLSHRSKILIVSGLSILEGGALLLATIPNNLYCSYVGYILFGALYAFSITVSGAEVAKYLEDDSFGLVFGINTFVALIFQSVLTVVVVDGHVLLLDIFGQYIAYAVFFIIIGFLFWIFILIEYFMFREKIIDVI